jgi:hypothetical protein
MRHLIATSLLFVTVFSVCQVQASTQNQAPVQLNSGMYASGSDQKPVLKITPDGNGRSVQIEGPHVPAATLSVNENQNFDTTTALSQGVVTRDFIRRCQVKLGQAKPCFKGLYDTASGKLRVREGDEFTVSARLLVLSSDSVLQMQWTTWTRDESMIAQKFTKQVLTYVPAAKSAGSKDVISL